MIIKLPLHNNEVEAAAVETGSPSPKISAAVNSKPGSIEDSLPQVESRSSPIIRIKKEDQPKADNSKSTETQRVDAIEQLDQELAAIEYRVSKAKRRFRRLA